MSFQAKMFNRKASDPGNKPDLILESIALQRGQKIADIGAGGGYFTLRFAEITGNEGKVYAVDTKPDFLDFIKNIARKKNTNNVVTILSGEDKLDLPERELDFIFMRNITHHIPDRSKYFESLKKFLKPDGRIAVIEYKPTRSFSFRGMFGHHVPKESIMEEMEEAGYSLEQEFDFLPEQHFTIYSKKSNRQN
jgi:arsenite methyltransferase